MSDKPEVMLIDLSSIGHQIYHVSASEPDPDFTHKTVVQRIHALAQGYDHVAICCDSGRSFRKDVSADYKANRPERDAILIHQMDLIRETLAADGFPVWAAEGFEADDLLAAATFESRAAGHPVFIVTGDKDLLQLVTDEAPAVRVKNVQTGAVLDSEGVINKLGVLPAQVRDWISLVGDTSDNIKGAVGIGAKTAANLLKQFGTLDDLYAVMDSRVPMPAVTEKLRQTLTDFRQRLDVVRALVTLRTDVPVPMAELLTPRVPPPMTADLTGVAETCEEAMDQILDDIAYAMPDSPAVENVAPTPVQASQEQQQRAAQLARVEPVVDAQIVPYERQLDPRSMGEAITLAKDMYTARNFAGAASPQTALATIMMGREMGLPAMTSLRTIHVIEGRHSMSAQLIVGLVLKSGMVEYVEPVEISDKAVTYRAKRVGRPEITLTHTIEMAITAGLMKPKSNWERIPTDMLVSRCSVRICRIVAPDVCANVYTPEEIAEMKEQHNG
jgi:5'-3' exonuclease